MFGFEYKYLIPSVIFRDIRLIGEYSAMDVVVLIVGILIIVGFVVYLFPIISIYFDDMNKRAQKKRNLKTINRMVLLRDLEDEISKELKLK